MLPAGDPGYSARRRLTGFPLPGRRGYPSSHYKCVRIPAMLSSILMLNGDKTAAGGDHHSRHVPHRAKS